MNISSIEITNVKGIAHRVFKLDLEPNKPNILVAPNGFGKSSFAIAFNSFKSSKIELDEKNYFKKNDANRPVVSITLSNGSTLIADDNQNTITNHFDVFVINNQTEPKSVIQSFNGNTFAKTSLEITPTTLVKTIPPKHNFSYNSKEAKTTFGVTGNKLLTNITELFGCAELLLRIDAEIDFTRFSLKKYENILTSSLDEINKQTGKGEEIKTWIKDQVLPSVQTLEEFEKLFKIITSFNFDEVTDEVDAFLCAWQILLVKNTMGGDFKKACKYLQYLDDKNNYTQTISAFNPVKERFDIKPKEENGSLIVSWPKAHEISNGQRDILTFITLLLKTRRTFKKRDCILVIDEIFDYLDDANLIAFQYYVSTFIDEMRKNKRRIFPILLTHLDPHFFNHFCFNDHKIKVHYIKEVNIKSNPQLLKLIYNRTDLRIQSKVDAYYFHFHPDIASIDLSSEFGELKLNLDWAKPEIFLKRIFREVRRYLLETDPFDPLAICFGVRIQIEKLVYSKIPDQENKKRFLEETNGTKQTSFCSKNRYPDPRDLLLIRNNL